jgi:hypothetical protein
LCTFPPHFKLLPFFILQAIFTHLVQCLYTKDVASSLVQPTSPSLKCHQPIGTIYQSTPHDVASQMVPPISQLSNAASQMAQPISPLSNAASQLVPPINTLSNVGGQLVTSISPLSNVASQLVKPIIPPSQVASRWYHLPVHPQDHP